MKKIIKNIFLIIVLSLNLSAYEAGKDYIILQNPITNLNNSVIEIFSYDCPFCYKFDKNIISKLMDDLNCDFVPIHMPQKAKFGEIATDMFATFLIMDYENKIKFNDINSTFNKAKSGLFKAYHEEKKDFGSIENKNDIEEFKKILLEFANISQDEFDKFKNSHDEIQDFLNLCKDEQIYEIAKLRGIPAFVVNGKYLIELDTIESYENLLDIIKELLKI